MGEEDEDERERTDIFTLEFHVLECAAHNFGENCWKSSKVLILSELRYYCAIFFGLGGEAKNVILFSGQNAFYSNLMQTL